MFRIAEQPVLMPARTLMGSTTGPVVDTQVTLRNGGRVYLSRQEVLESAKFFPDVVGVLAKDFGWTDPDETEQLHATIEHLQAQLAEALSGQPKVLTLDDALKLAEGLQTVA